LVWATLILSALFLAYSHVAHPLTAGMRVTWLAVGVGATVALVWRMTADASGRDDYGKLDPGVVRCALLVPLMGSGAGFLWSARKRTGR
jgi:hypothetical protein